MGKQLTLDEFSKRIDRADKRIVKTLFQKLKVLSLKAEREAKTNATDYPRVRTGRLRSSITGLVDAKDGRPRVLLRAGGNTNGAPVNYAQYVEFGTKYMRPRLFLGRAIQKVQQNEIPKDLKNLLRVALQEDR
jgi:HK97 gp10 family phage protein